MWELVELFKTHGEIRVINTPLDIHLEIPHIAYIEAKLPNGGKALLFTNPKSGSKTFKTPVFMNIFGSNNRLRLILGAEIDIIKSRMEAFLKPPKGLKKLALLPDLLSLLPKKAFFKKSQQIKRLGNDINLYDLPILTTWEDDAAPFITLGQIYTKSLDNKIKNLGMYRLQIKSKNELFLHWQIHKDGNLLYHEYKKAKLKMPVSIGLGGDALLSFAAQAPLPHGLYELALFSFIKKKRTKLTKCLTNDLMLPHDLDFVIEGLVDTQRELELEGPFGDHTGFYTPKEPYPILEVTAITSKLDPIYPATVVGKPPLEDKYMGRLIEELFTPLVKLAIPGVLEFHMPENGVFHNLLLMRVKQSYPSHARQILSSLWGNGQMSFAKHVIILNEFTPDLRDYERLSEFILNNFDVKNLIFTHGVSDALDHAARNFGESGKVALLCTENKQNKQNLQDLSLLQNALQGLPEFALSKVFFEHTNCPILIIGIKKQGIKILDRIKDLAKNSATFIVIFVDEHKNDLNNPYMLLWRIVNSIDVSTDCLISNAAIFIDATDKSALEGFNRIYPKETNATRDVLKKLEELNLIPPLSDKIYRAFHIDKNYNTEK
ncbi:MAG: menaquinone biosynthesis decarboxylase [Helicobacter sp.]|nr:menaquinone biosynthesis decarboxylase [Helicobacter sp.]